MDQDLLNYLEQRFSAIDQRFNEVDQRFRETGQQIQALQEGTTQRFDRLETEVRGAWISIEDLRGQVKLVAEGVANNNERLDRHAEEVSRKLDDLESLIHQSYEDLDSRVRKLEATG